MPFSRGRPPHHIGIDRRHRLIRRWAVTDAARHDGALLPELIDPGSTASEVWADTAYCQSAPKFDPGSASNRWTPITPLPGSFFHAELQRDRTAGVSSRSHRTVGPHALTSPSVGPVTCPRSVHHWLC